MNILNDAEYHIFVSAMSHEEKVCRELDQINNGGAKLVPICKSIRRKVDKAVEAKRGEWVEVEFYPPLSDASIPMYRCSKCNLTFESETNFCPNCGADMRK